MKTFIVTFLLASLFIGKCPESITDDSKKKVVKLFPNPTTDGKVNVVATEPGVLHLYVFDNSGTLTKQVQLTNKSKQTIEGLNKGEYEYDVFKNDESIERGKIVVK